MRVAAYLRVSTSEQTYDNQLPAIKAWCDSRGYELTQVYSENESAWKDGHQRELARLLREVRHGTRKYDILLVWALDRLSRGGAAAILNLVDTFGTYGVKIISLQESWTEAPGAIGEVLYAIAGWVAKMESDRRSERTKAGLTRARANGKKLGRPAGKRDSKPRRKKRPVVFKYGATGSGDNEQ